MSDSPRIISFGHLANSGKDTAADVLVDRLGFVKLSFSAPLKEITMQVFPEIAVIVDALGWDAAKDAHPEVRVALQTLGLACRDVLGADVWINALMSKLQPGVNYAISDVRMVNEAEAILAAGGSVYRIDRPGIRPANNHVTETALANWTGWTGIVDNSGTLEDLANTVLAIAGAPQ